MIIAIRSELDSRVLLYPMMRTLWNHGSILVISRNEQLNRLIEDKDTFGFRNATIIVDKEGAIDDIRSSYGIAHVDYDFIILDNTAFTTYDLMFIPLGARSSEEFMDEVDLLVQEDENEHQNIFLLQFGKEAKQAKSKAPKEKKEKESAKKKKTKEEMMAEYDPAEKFHKEVAKIKVEENRIKKHNVTFPTFQEIEQVEAEHKFYNVPSGLVSVFHEAFGGSLGLDLMNFRKELRNKDEGSSYLKSVESGAE